MNMTVNAALTPSLKQHGPELLIRHCLTIDAPARTRLPAKVRLEHALGPELARELLRTLTSPRRR